MLGAAASLCEMSMLVIMPTLIVAWQGDLCSLDRLSSDQTLSYVQVDKDLLVRHGKAPGAVEFGQADFGGTTAQIELDIDKVVPNELQFGPSHSLGATSQTEFDSEYVECTIDEYMHGGSCDSSNFLGASGAELHAGEDPVTSADYDPVCKCELCSTDLDASAPKLFIMGRGDGLGARAATVTYALAMAAKYGMHFGGVSRNGKEVASHGVDTETIMGHLFGSDCLFHAGTPPQKNFTFHSVNQLEEFLDSGRQLSGNVMLYSGSIAGDIDGRDWQSGSAVRMRSRDEYFTSTFLSRFRHVSRIADDPSHVIHRTGRPIVAIHLRRGDTHDEMRVTPDTYYYALVERLSAHLDNPDIHVFTETGPSHRLEEFDGYTERGMTLHADTDVEQAWTYFALADVLVVAKSTFSAVPANLNPNCVIYQAMWHSPLDAWMVTRSEDVAFDDSALKRCLARIRLNSV